jgi:hypothetical protein
MDLPETLHGRLFLLAYERKAHRFDLYRLWLLGFALRGPCPYRRTDPRTSSVGLLAASARKQQSWRYTA